MACSTSSLRVTSSPEGADVYMVPEGQQPIRLGKTPLFLSSQQINNQTGNSVQIRVQKEGYQTEAFLTPKVVFSSSVDLSVKLSENKLPLACTQQADASNRLARDVAKSQQFIFEQKYVEAQRLLLNILDDNPGSSVILDLLGNVNYLNKNTSQALNYYERALDIDPNGTETKRMVQKLRSITGARTPAGGN